MSPIKHGDYLIPARCRHVYYAMSGILGHTEYTRVYGKWRYIDLITVTGRNTSDRKLRELREECPGMIAEEAVNGEHGQFNRFWLAAPATLKRIALQPVTTNQAGTLFDMPAAAGE